MRTAGVHFRVRLRHQLIVGGSHKSRLRTADAAGSSPTVTVPAALLPLTRIDAHLIPGAPPRTVRVDDVERAFTDELAGRSRLILTQSTYTIQKLVDSLDPGDRIVATGDRRALEGTAPEVFQRRGVWRLFEIVELAPGDAEDQPAAVFDPHEFSSASPASSAVAALRGATTCRAAGDIAGARAALDDALRLAPDWEAVHYEDGKLWLACEEMERAAAAFRRACELMPTFSAAFSNLGAILGELDRPDEAIEAFSRALASDPDSFTVLNNIGVVSRELGRLDQSEAALRRVIALAPAFVFGHYNLGHTLFLAGRYPEALAAYEEGHRRDPQKNRRQGCRLAMARFAAGDRAGAARDLWSFADAAPPEERAELLAEAQEIASALVATDPAFAAHADFPDEIAQRT